MAAPSTTTVLAIAAVAAALVVWELVRRWIDAASKSRRARARMRRAKIGERRAAALLEARGFELEGEQVRHTYVVRRGDREVPVVVVADYLVRSGGRSYVAEVKTGEVAPNIETAATRRQLLEYQVAFRADGVLLVDPERERVDRVEFPELTPAPAPRRYSSLILALVAGALMAQAVGWYLGRAPAAERPSSDRPSRAER